MYSEVIFPEEPIKVGDKFVYPTYSDVVWLINTKEWFIKQTDAPHNFGFSGFIKVDDDSFVGAISIPTPEFVHMKAELND